MGSHSVKGHTCGEHVCIVLYLTLKCCSCSYMEGGCVRRYNKRFISFVVIPNNGHLDRNLFGCIVSEWNTVSCEFIFLTSVKYLSLSVVYILSDFVLFC